MKPLPPLLLKDEAGSSCVAQNRSLPLSRECREAEDGARGGGDLEASPDVMQQRAHAQPGVLGRLLDEELRQRRPVQRHDQAREPALPPVLQVCLEQQGHGSLDLFHPQLHRCQMRPIASRLKVNNYLAY